MTFATVIGFVPRVKMKEARIFFRSVLSAFGLLVLLFRARNADGKNSGFAIPFGKDMVCVTDSPAWKGTELVCNRSFVLFEKGDILRCTSIQRSNRSPFKTDFLVEDQFVEAEIFTSHENDEPKNHKENFVQSSETPTVCKIACWPMAEKPKSSNRHSNKINSIGTKASQANKYLQAKPTEQSPVKTILYVKFTNESHKLEKRAATDTVKEQPTSVRWERPLIVLKFISCLTLTILVSCSIIVYFYCGMFYQECLAHLCSELSLVAAHICILAHTTDSVKLDKNLCSLTAVLLQYFFQVSFLSLTLEAFFLLRIFLGCSPSYKTPIKDTTKKTLYRTLLGGPLSLLFLAWGFPAVIAAFSAYFFFDEYVAGNTNCWYNARSSSFSVVVGPVGLFATLHILFIAPMFIYCDVPERVKREHFYRARAGLNTRWASVLLMLFSLVSWATGLLSEDDNLRSPAMLITFCIFTILLGSFTPAIRISTEDQVRQRIWIRISPDETRKIPWPISSFDMFDDDVHYFDLHDDPRSLLTTAASQRTLLKTAASIQLQEFGNKQNSRSDKPQRSVGSQPPPSRSNSRRSPIHRRV